MQSLDQARLVRNYAFCLIYPLFRRRYDRAVVGRTKEMPMTRFIGVTAGVASLLLLALGRQRRDRSRRRGWHHRRQPQRPLGHHPRLVQLLTWTSSDATAKAPRGALCRSCASRQGSDDAA
jgi:hypothetical protein